MPSLYALIPLLLALPLTHATTSPKRGLVYVAPAKSTSDNTIWTQPPSDLTWYYNYQDVPTAAFAGNGLEFVPMLWGAPTNPTTNTSFLDSIKSQLAAGANITSVLFLNEPDGSSATGGSATDAITAAQVWQTQIEPLKAHGIKLGGPAVTGAQNGFNWLQNFFNACAGNCSVDFLPVHWYGNFEGLASHIGQVRGTYMNSSIWVTEYALPNSPLKDTQGFFNTSEEYFDRIDYIERYSYFGAFRSSVSNVGPNAAFLTQDGKLTDIGSWYLGRAATGNVPKGAAPSSLGNPLTGWALGLVGLVLGCVLV
ncbi:MAG: hypothetical protein M1824_000086 [Vezdaea acicularis]|nr:MAG: hypothetical protein M1824_000086 [Vezdaea acicularis]